MKLNFLASRLLFSVFFFCFLFSFCSATNIVNIALAQSIATTTVTITAIVADSGGSGGNGGNNTGNGGWSTGGGSVIGGGYGILTQNSIPVSSEVILQGTSNPNSTVYLLIGSDVISKTFSGIDGKFNISVSNLEPGIYNFGIMTKSSDGYISKLQVYTIAVPKGVITTVNGIVMKSTIESALKNKSLSGVTVNQDLNTVLNIEPIDFNDDDHVNILDFNIMIYWYHHRPVSTPPKIDLSHDGKIDMSDFSILAYYWTG